MNYLHIASWRDFERWGFYFLTMESDPYNRRGLFDVTQEGLENLQAYLGVKEIALYPARNYGVGSLLLSRAMLNDAAVFWAFSINKMKHCYVDKRSFQFTDELLSEEDERYYEEVIHNENKDGRERNVHMMSGRTV